MPAETIEELFTDVRASEGYELFVHLETQVITRPCGAAISFDVAPFLKERLLNGWDQISLTLLHEADITAYEKQRGIA